MDSVTRLTNYSSFVMSDVNDNTMSDMIQVVNSRNRSSLMNLRLSCKSRRLNVSMCENERGRYLRIVDFLARITVPGSGIHYMLPALKSLEEATESMPAPAQIGEASTGSTSQSGPNEVSKLVLVDSRRFVSEGRKFYLDIIEDNQELYLKIAQASSRRITIIVPIAMLSLLVQAVKILVDKISPEPSINDASSIKRFTRIIERTIPKDDGFADITVIQRELCILGKRVVFESGANRRGGYIKIMETSSTQHTTVVLPHAAVPEMVRLLQEVIISGDPANTVDAPVIDGGGQ